MAPLLDSRGNLRYFIGAQVDVSGLVKDCTDLEAFQHMLAIQEGHEVEDEPKDEFQELCEMFNNAELDTVRKYGGHMHREHLEDKDDASMHHRPRVLIRDVSNFDVEKAAAMPIKPEGRLAGVYKHVSKARHDTGIILTPFTVPSDPTGAFPSHSLRLSILTRSRNLAIPLPRPYRRLRPRSRFSS